MTNTPNNRHIANDKFDHDSAQLPDSDRADVTDQDPSDRGTKRDEELVPDHDSDDGAHVVVDQENIVAQDSIRDDLFGPTSVHPEDYTA